MKEKNPDNSKDRLIQELATWWNKSGLEKGDVALVHSSLSAFLKYLKSSDRPAAPADILESLILAAGEKGTLIFPTYNFGFTRGETFDIMNTKSETGALTEAARLHKDSKRTGHPLFSFAVIGALKDEIGDLNNKSAFGKDSPFAKLMEHDGKIAALDVAGEFCMTFYHYVEECENAPNRFFKTFRGKYIDRFGEESEREYIQYSRKLDLGVETDVKPMEEYLWSKGLYSGSRPGEGTRLHVIRAKTVYEEAAAFIRSGRSEGMLYKISK
ncbi:MAG: AAC(3) family N-acetyltransferase [Bacteroidetes bacterium]|nr:AAC(3) family N-acetyltransferase [Bacteroidota bacterium]